MKLESALRRIRADIDSIIDCRPLDDNTLAHQLTVIGRQIDAQSEMVQIGLYTVDSDIEDVLGR